jgi:hypothetical protein
MSTPSIVELVVNAPVSAPPVLGKAALAVVVVVDKTPSRVAMSTPSIVELVVKAPVSAPPALGKAALAVVVVDVSIPSRVAMSTPSIVELVVNAPVSAPPADARNPVRGTVKFTFPEPSSGIMVTDPLALFNLIAIFIYL